MDNFILTRSSELPLQKFHEIKTGCSQEGNLKSLSTVTHLDLQSHPLDGGEESSGKLDMIAHLYPHFESFEDNHTVTNDHNGNLLKILRESSIINKGP